MVLTGTARIARRHSRPLLGAGAVATPPASPVSERYTARPVARRFSVTLRRHLIVSPNHTADARRLVILGTG